MEIAMTNKITVDFTDVRSRPPVHGTPEPSNKPKASPQQKAVEDWVVNESGSLNVVARAGCGKTTMLLNVVETIVNNNLGRVFLGAYNKAIATEIQEKLRQRGVSGGVVEASTMHSMGFKLWRMVAPRVKVDEKKMFGILDAY